MSLRWQVVRQQMAPASRTTVMVVLALGLALIGMACSGVFVLTGSVDAESPGGTALGMTIFYMPVVVLILVIAAIMEKRALARALVFSAAALAMTLGGIIVAVAMALDPDLGLGGAAGVFVLFCAPVLLVLYLPALYYGLKSRPAIKDALRAAREERALDLIDEHGAMTLMDLGQELGVTPSAAAGLVEDLLHEERLAGVLYRRHKMVYGLTTLAGRQRLMLGVVTTRGRIAIEDLAQELGVSVGLAKEWLYDLVRRGRFTGYVNWDDGILYSAEAQALRKAQKCPNCSGAMALAGKGVMTCGYCGAQVFI